MFKNIAKKGSQATVHVEHIKVPGESFLQASFKMIYKLPSKHTTLIQRHYLVDLNLRRRATYRQH